MIAQESCSIYVPDNSGNQIGQGGLIRIIYIIEEIQKVTLYCCCARRAGQPESGYSQPKILVQNKSQNYRMAG